MRESRSARGRDAGGWTAPELGPGLQVSHGHPEYPLGYSERRSDATLSSTAHCDVACPLQASGSGLTKHFGKLVAVRDLTPRSRRGRGLRVPGAEWRGQDDHHPHADRPGAADQRLGAGRRLRRRARAARGQAPGRLSGRNAVSVRQTQRARVPGVHGRAVRGAAGAGSAARRAPAQPVRAGRQGRRPGRDLLARHAPEAGAGRGACCTSRRCCSWTSRRRASTRAARGWSKTCWWRWSSAGTPCFCRRTCSRSPSTCAIASASSTTARSSPPAPWTSSATRPTREADSLEDIFLQLTGGSEERELAAYLRDDVSSRCLRPAAAASACGCSGTAWRAGRGACGGWSARCWRWSFTRRLRRPGRLERRACWSSASRAIDPRRGHRRAAGAAARRVRADAGHQPEQRLPPSVHGRRPGVAAGRAGPGAQPVLAEGLRDLARLAARAAVPGARRCIGFGQTLRLPLVVLPAGGAGRPGAHAGRHARSAPSLTLALARVRFGESILGLSRLLAILLFLPIGVLGRAGAGLRSRTGSRCSSARTTSTRRRRRCASFGPPPAWAPTTWAAHVLLGDEAALAVAGLAGGRRASCSSRRAARLRRPVSGRLGAGALRRPQARAVRCASAGRLPRRCAGRADPRPAAEGLAHAACATRAGGRARWSAWSRSACRPWSLFAGDPFARAGARAALLARRCCRCRTWRTCSAASKAPRRWPTRAATSRCCAPRRSAWAAFCSPKCWAGWCWSWR